MNFENEKNQFLKKPDKSMAHAIDKAILNLCKKLNKNKNYFTTSSCAGRIILIKETGKKQENAFLKVWHDKISLKDLMNEFKKIKYKKMVYLRLEPCIIHVSCKTLNAADELVQKARHSGWKKAGIISLKKNIVEMLSTENISTPVMDNGKILADKKYYSALVKEANKKLILTREKIKTLEKRIK